MINKLHEMKTAEDLQTMMDIIREKSIKLLKEQLARIEAVLKQSEPSAAFDGYIDLPKPIIFTDMEDENLIENIERIHTSGTLVELVLHGDGREFSVVDLSTQQLIDIVRQLEGITSPQQIEVA